MHEMSVALEVCRIAATKVGRHNLDQVVTIALDVGTESGIEAANLDFCLGVLLKAPPFASAKPVIEIVPGDVLAVRYLEVDDGRPNN